MTKYKTKRIREKKDIIAEIAWSVDKNEVYIASLDVVSYKRGIGLGRQLLMHVLSKYPDKKVKLYAIQGSKGFWEKQGFKFDSGGISVMKINDVITHLHQSSSSQL